MGPSKLPFVTVDVFTSSAYSGNPLAIVRVPAGSNLSQDQKQLIAREFNLSETVFLHLPEEEQDQDDGGARPISRTVDIFTTNCELPFAGHPTIGTACYVLSNGFASNPTATNITTGEFLTKAGKIELQYDAGTGVARAGIPHNVRIHAASFPLQDVQKFQPLLRPDAFVLEPSAAGFPVVSIVNGMTFILAEFKSVEDMKPLVGLTSMPTVKLDEGWNRPASWIYSFVRLQDSKDGSRNIRSRLMMEGGEGECESILLHLDTHVFALVLYHLQHPPLPLHFPFQPAHQDSTESRTHPLSSSLSLSHIPTDPATGSAASALSSYLALRDGQPGETIRFHITQGVEMGRQSDITVDIKLDSDGQVETVHLSGRSVQVMEGMLAY